MKYQTETSNGYKFYERFSNFLISELLNEEIEDCNHDNGEFNFFYNCQNLDENNIDLKYPNDVDTTSIALSILYKRSLIDINIINNVVNKLLLDSNIIQVYFVNKDDKRYGLTDPIVCSNALYLICLINKDNNDNLKLTKNYILKSLDTFESRYYVSFDSFLYFLSRTVSSFKHLEIEFGTILRKKIKERNSINEGKDYMNSSNHYEILLMIKEEKDSYFVFCIIFLLFPSLFLTFLTSFIINKFNNIYSIIIYMIYI